MIGYQESEEKDSSRLSGQVRLTGKAMRMKAQGKEMVSDEEGKFGEDSGQIDVKLEPDGNLVLDGVSKGESFKNVYHFFFRRSWQESES